MNCANSKLCRWLIAIPLIIFGIIFCLTAVFFKLAFDNGCTINNKPYPAGSSECKTAGLIGGAVFLLIGAAEIITGILWAFCCYKKANCENGTGRSVNNMSPKMCFWFGILFFLPFGIIFCIAGIFFYVMFAQGCEINGRQYPKGSQECKNVGMIGGGVFLLIGIASIIASGIWTACQIKKQKAGEQN